jgi:superfamily I DNA/RNA helicase
MITAVLGGPGTGKTHYLVKRVQNLLEKTSIDSRQVGYFSFTKRAALEAKRRISETLGLPQNQFPFFQTLHSMSFKQLGLNKNLLLNQERMGEFAKWLGLEISNPYWNSYTSDDTWPVKTNDDHCMFQMNYARITLMPEEKAEWLPWHVHPKIARRNIQSYANYKKAKHLYDYTDMLEQLVEKESYPNLDAIIIDESQDLSPLQWRIVLGMLEHNSSAIVYIGGDDDQAIYEWAGASFETFRDVVQSADKHVILDRSHRVPFVAHAMASYAIRHCRNRIPKSWRPTEERGTIKYADSYENIRWDLKKQYLCLARHNHLLRKAVSYFKERKLPFSWIGDKDSSPIKLSSIHGAKGAQASTVVLDVSMAKASMEGMQSVRGYDAEARVWYTALTRTQHDLILVRPAKIRFPSVYIGDYLGYTYAS